MRLPRRRIDDLYHALDALVHCDGGLFDAKGVSAAVAEIGLDPAGVATSK
jgi:hypothetical protein